MKRHRVLAMLLAPAVLIGAAGAQQPYYPPPPPGAAVVAYAPAQLDQMLAPIALYPDPLLTSILTAATYPVEVDSAAQWLNNPGAAALTDGALVTAMAGTGWDPSVQSLVPFRPVLEMMDQQLAWTQAIGNAFLAQPQDVMASIQRLRRAAIAAGTLVSGPYQSVSDDGIYITITPTQPQMLYVPVYSPDSVYGAWPYPGYLPDYFGPPPGLSAEYAAGALGFSVGFGIVDLLWDWGDWDWRDHDVRVDPGRFNRMNAGHPPVAATTWQHDPGHRRGAPYVDTSSRARFDTPVPGSADQRRQFRFATPPQAAVPAPVQVNRGQPRAEATAPAQAPRGQPRAEAPAAPPVQVLRGPPAAAPPPSRAPTAFDAVSRGPQAQAEAQRGQQSRHAAAAPEPQRPAAPAPPRPAAPQPQRQAAPPQRPAAAPQPQAQPGERR